MWLKRTGLGGKFTSTGNSTDQSMHGNYLLFVKMLIVNRQFYHSCSCNNTLVMSFKQKTYVDCM